MKILKLLKAVQPFNAGEVAGFDDEAAEKLVAGGYAILHSEASETESPPTPTPGVEISTRNADDDKQPVAEADTLNNVNTKPDRQHKR